MTLSSATNPSQNGPRTNVNESLLPNPQSSRTGASQYSVSNSGTNRVK